MNPGDDPCASCPTWLECEIVECPLINPEDVTRVDESDLKPIGHKEQ